MASQEDVGLYDFAPLASAAYAPQEDPDEQFYRQLEQQAEARARAASKIQNVSLSSLKAKASAKIEVHPEESLSATIKDVNSLSAAAAMLKKSNLDYHVEKSARETGPVSMFLPSNSAFAKMDRDVLKALQDPKAASKMRSFLRQHIVPAGLQDSPSAAGWFADGRSTFEPNRSISVQSHPQAEAGYEKPNIAVLHDETTGQAIAKARIIKTIDLVNGDGKVHIIDSPLLPED